MLSARKPWSHAEGSDEFEKVLVLPVSQGGVKTFPRTRACDYVVDGASGAGISGAARLPLVATGFVIEKGFDQMQ